MTLRAFRSTLHSKPWLAPGIAAWLATLVWTLIAGKDFSWDVLNHHLYVPFAWLTGRIDSDFFGAGPQSYQNPLGYAPFYLMVHADWPDWVIGLAQAGLHGLSAVFCALIARELWRGQVNEKRWIAIATALAFVTPTFLVVAGTSSTDPLSASTVLCAAYLLLRAGAQRAAGAFAAGLVLGLSFAIKQSNVVFILALACMTAWQCIAGRRTWESLMYCAAGGVGGLFAGMGAYSLRLWHDFGNPFFPLFNNVFHSPYAPQGAVLAMRFIPHNLHDWLMRPFSMASMQRYVYQESFVPDLRPAVLVLVVGASVLFALVRRRLPARGAVTASRWRAADGDLAIFSVLSYVLWMASSGNGRYAIALMMLTGVWLARACYLGLPRTPARVVALLCLLLQPLHYLSGAEPRIAPEPWTGRPWFALHVPEQLRRTPYLHVSFGGSQTSASIATFFAPDGALVSASGPMGLPMTGPIGAQLRRRFSQWQGRTRVLMPGFEFKAERTDELRYVIDTMLQRLEIGVDWNDCLRIEYHPGVAAADSPYWWIHAGRGVHQERSWLSCRAVARTPMPIPGDERAADVARVYKILEQACPQMYGPAPMVTERSPTTWERIYANSDTLLSVSLTDGVLASSERAMNARYLGTVDEILRGKFDPQCTPWAVATPE